MNYGSCLRGCALRQLLASVFFFIVLAPVVVAEHSGRPAMILALVGAGPRVVGDGAYFGGDGIPKWCDCTNDKDGVDCPDKGNGTCTRTYHYCYIAEGQTAQKYCVGSGPASYCGGTSCKTTQYGTCVGSPCL